MNNAGLRAAYIDEMMDDPAIHLEDFATRAAQGAYGPVSADDLRDFLESIGRDIVASIYTRVAATPGLEHDMEDRIEAKQQELAILIARLCPRPT